MLNKSCIVITHPHPLDAPGGGTRSCLQIAKNLEKLGAEVILVPVSPKSIVEHQPETEQVIHAHTNQYHYLLNGISVAKIVEKLLEQKQVDAVIGWGYEAAFLPRLLKSNQIIFGMIAASPSYTEWVERQTNLRFIKRFADDWFRWRVLKQANIVFVSSSFTQNELTYLFQIDTNRTKIVRRGIDALFGKVERLFSGEISNLIFYGSLAHLKGVFDVVNALGQVFSKKNKNWKLKIAGWGNEKAVREAVLEQGIEDRVIFLGCLTPQELAKELEWADLAILPSRAESFGRAIAEAQAAGLAVVSYNIGSIPEIIEHGVTGWLVPFKRVDLLANTIIEAMQNPEKTFQMGVKGREIATQRFTWEKTACSILSSIELTKQKM